MFLYPLSTKCFLSAHNSVFFICLLLNFLIQIAKASGQSLFLQTPPSHKMYIYIYIYIYICLRYVIYGPIGSRFRINCHNPKPNFYLIPSTCSSMYSVLGADEEQFVVIRYIMIKLKKH